MRKKSQSLIIGSIKRHPDGFGFFIPDDKEHPDVYIPKHSMAGIMSTDRVMIEVFPEGRGDRFRGEIVRILSRGTKRVVGPFTPVDNEYGKIKDDGKAWGFDLKIKMENSLGAKPGQTVVAEIDTYPDEGQVFSGKVIEILGNVGDPLNDIKRILATANIPVDFSSATLAEAKSFHENPTEKDFKGRKDLRDKNLFNKCNNGFFSTISKPTFSKL
jgi:ribonuclease R